MKEWFETPGPGRPFGIPVSGPDLDAIERRLYEQIRDIQDRHARELEPWIRQLTSLMSLRPRPPVLVDPSKLSREDIERLNRMAGGPGTTL